ncbi:hypothetical protein PRIPAC_70343 [Pristionchus pacificus]|uniref:Uncharacterized protein n=1 Tax=Pristionchus pacificus TaxID=54126 RepID=A0A454XNN2_PRIPA|nr:hypothetical protein PRIPAC_70343 [Pristionchus pacificus]|eukprot:PDM76812.1 hypothetical protein PRIPAC_42207 [Pristionchus pacificus]
MDSTSSSVDILQSITPLEIPRPKCHGMQFVPTRGRYGFYRTIRAEGSKYGVSIKGMGPRRPVLSKDLFTRPQTVIEEEERSEQSQGSTESINHHSSSASSQISSDRSSPIEIEPDYPLDDDEPQQPPSSRPQIHPTQTTNQRPILSTKF